MKSRETMKIKDLTNENDAAFIYALCQTIGISKSSFPQDNEIEYLMEYLRGRYATWALGEIKYAFEWDAENKDRKDHFQNLSVAYLAHVLQKYNRSFRQLMNQEIIKIRNKPMPVSKQLHAKVYDAQYYINKNIKEGRMKYNNEYNMYGAKGIKLMYEYLERTGQIKIPIKQKVEIVERVFAKLKEECTGKTPKDLRAAIKKVENLDKKSTIRKHCLHVYFDYKRGDIKELNY